MVNCELKAETLNKYRCKQVEPFGNDGLASQRQYVQGVVVNSKISSLFLEASYHAQE